MTITQLTSTGLNRPLSIQDVQVDWRTLDDPEYKVPGGERLISHEGFNCVDEHLNVEFIPEGLFGKLFRWLPKLRSLAHALRVLRSADQNTAVICNGGSDTGKYIAILNCILPIRRRTIVMWEAFCEGRSRVKRQLIRLMVLGCDVVVVYSHHQIASHSRYLKIAEDRFCFLPYKANHSKWPPLKSAIGNFVFSGGNSKRDYLTLFDAVRDTSIPVIVSTTDPRTVAERRIPSNVIVVAATEPAFARLTANSRFTVIPIVKCSVRGAGETNVCNAMWHGKPVIVADDMSAFEYIDDGENGYIVRAGDTKMLRTRILSLWNDPELTAKMGRKAHLKIANAFTHQHFHRRLMRLAALSARSRA